MALDFDPHAGDDDPELLDRIDALRVLRADSPEEKGRLRRTDPARDRGAGHSARRVGVVVMLRHF